MKIQIKNYTFDASTGKITFTDFANIKKDRIINIVNITESIAIYNYINKDLDGSVDGNKLTLNYDTSTMHNDDDLYIIYDDDSNSATEAKQDEIITAINSQGGTTFATNEIYEDGTDTYFCKESKDGEWYIMKIDENSVFTCATAKNNETVTSYADARTDVTTLTYETYNNAF